MRREDAIDTLIIGFIDGYWIENWTSPSVREIAAYVGLSISSTHYRLHKLVDMCLLERKELSSQRVYYRGHW